ncbi:MAG: hypothetical protein ACWA5P_13985 [bacterium]
MNYRYTYNDWEKGNIIWNDIESHKYDDDYISNRCISKIQNHQQIILDDISNEYTENLVKGYISNRRKSRDRSTLVSGLLRTIDNLLNKDIDSFKDTITMDEKQAMTESFTLERKVKIIPPLNWTMFDRNDIDWIQRAYSHFYTLDKWNIEVIETPVKEELSKYVECKNTINAKAYNDFPRRLRQYNGVVFNTFSSDIGDFKLGQLRSDLIKKGLISRDTNREYFIKAFSGYYLFRNERISWLKNLETLRYFITQLNNEITYQKDYGKWQVVCNCFVRGNKDINSDSLRKATNITAFKDQKDDLDDILSSVI